MEEGKEKGRTFGGAEKKKPGGRNGGAMKVATRRGRRGFFDGAIVLGLADRQPLRCEEGDRKTPLQLRAEEEKEKEEGRDELQVGSRAGLTVTGRFRFASSVRTGISDGGPEYKRLAVAIFLEDQILVIKPQPIGN